jgi:N-acetylneuraminate synthase/N,N'-diacetyllegionaminate synthase
MGYVIKTMTPGHTFVIAEAGVNHNGDLALALKLCDAAKAAGADAVKFQTWKTEALMLPEAPLANYQQEAGYVSQFEMAKALELLYTDFITLKYHCQSIGIQFLSTPDEIRSLDFLTETMALSTIKIGSGEVTNLLFLTAAGQKGIDVILSTGMSDMNEVAIAVETLLKSGAHSVSLLHCTSNYPTAMKDVNLRAMCQMREEFKLPVGYSDHTEGIEVAVAAVALGAVIIEKHLTLDRNMPGPDHKASLEPDQFAEMVQAIRNTEKALGDGIKKPQPSEIPVKKVVRKCLVANCAIQAGEPFTIENVTAMRTGGGVDASLWPQYENRPSPRNYLPLERIESL